MFSETTRLEMGMSPFEPAPTWDNPSMTLRLADGWIFVRSEPDAAGPLWWAAEPSSLGRSPQVGRVAGALPYELVTNEPAPPIRMLLGASEATHSATSSDGTRTFEVEVPVVDAAGLQSVGTIVQFLGSGQPPTAYRFPGHMSVEARIDRDGVVRTLRVEQSLTTRLLAGQPDLDLDEVVHATIDIEPLDVPALPVPDRVAAVLDCRGLSNDECAANGFRILSVPQAAPEPHPGIPFAPT